MALNKRTISVFAALMALCLVFAGCSSTGRRDKSDRHENEAEEIYETTVACESTNSYVGDPGINMYSGADVESASAEYKSDDFSGYYDTNSDSRRELNPEEGRLLIRRVNISIDTLNYTELCNSVTERAKALGGYIESSTIGGTGNARDLRSAYLVIRVPDDQLDTLINELGGQGIITSRSETSDDVTLDYVDTQSKLEAYRIEQEQLLEMLDEAKDLDTIILLQNELTNVRYEIEYYESSLRMLENQVSYATLTLNISEVIEETEVEEAHVVTFSEEVKDTFEEAVENTKIFFQNLVLGTVAALPVIIPILVVAVIVVIVVIVNVRKSRRMRAKLKASAANEKEDSEEKN